MAGDGVSSSAIAFVEEAIEGVEGMKETTYIEWDGSSIDGEICDEELSILVELTLHVVSLEEVALFLKVLVVVVGRLLRGVLHTLGEDCEKRRRDGAFESE